MSKRYSGRVCIVLYPNMCRAAENSQCRPFKSGGCFRPIQARATPVVLGFWPPRFVPRVPSAYGGEIAHVHEHREAVKRALSCQITAVIMKTASQFKDGSVYAGYCRQSCLSGYQWSFLPLCGCSCTTQSFDSLSDILFYSSAWAWMLPSEFLTVTRWFTSILMYLPVSWQSH